MTLPIEVADAAMVESQRQGDAPLRVLAVLHDEAERAEVGRLLEGWRFDAGVVGDCDAGLGHVQPATPSRWHFGVVLLDGLVPGRGAFARRLRELSPAPGVVWITPEDGRVPGDISGVREQIGRPVKGPALFDAIMQAVVERPLAAERGAAGVAAPAPRPRRRRPRRQPDGRPRAAAVDGLDVDLVSDGEAAVAAALAAPYDVVLMDCQMPVLDGVEATRRIRRATAERRTHTPRGSSPSPPTPPPTTVRRALLPGWMRT